MRLQLVRRGPWNIWAVAVGEHECPLLDFLEGLPPNIEAAGDKLIAVFEYVSESGPNNLPDSLSHQVGNKGDGLWQFTKGRIRVIWFYDQGRVVICTHGFIKKSQKTPAQEINRALTLKRRYESEKLTGGLIYEQDE